ncbi:MAG: glycosyltransferase family 4 protein [Oscillospiraceae bacterium]|nr:glycosyltransferase family 4 protein [Oscillospiraceae bacterium]
MKILYITPSLPNEFSRIRTKNILEAFKRNGDNVTLVSLYYKENELKSFEKEKQLVKKAIVIKQSKIVSFFNCIQHIFTKVPLRMAYVKNRKLHKFFKNMSQKDNYDMVYIKRLRMAQYAKHFNKQKVIIDLTDSMTKYYDRLRYKAKGREKLISIEEYYKIKKYEKVISENYKTVICSKDDKNYIEKMSGHEFNDMKVVNNVIDTEKWINTININQSGHRVKMAFSGVFSVSPNTLSIDYLIKNIMPKLSDNFTVTFVGKDCPEYLLKKANDRIHFTGYVEDMREELSKYDIYVCPIMTGAGTKNKILQAACVGLPIIANDLAIEGLNSEIKKFIFFANDDMQIIEQIQKINLMETDKLSEILKEQQLFIKNNYDIPPIAEEIIEVIKSEKNNFSLS